MIVIGIPTMGTIPTKVVGCIGRVIREFGSEVELYCTNQSLIYDARHALFQYALNSGADLVFIDSDILFSPEAFRQLLSHKKPIVSGLYYGRSLPSRPIAYSKVKPTNLFRNKPELVQLKPEDLEPFMEVAGVGLGFCLIRHEVLKAVNIDGKNPFEPYGNMGEDFSFLNRCKKKGYKIYLDTTLGLKHIGEYEYGR